MRDRLDYWLNGRAHARKPPRLWLRPFCWLLGGHTYGLVFGDDERCLTCGRPDAEGWDDFYEDRPDV